MFLFKSILLFMKMGVFWVVSWAQIKLSIRNSSKTVQFPKTIIILNSSEYSSQVLIKG